MKNIDCEKAIHEHECSTRSLNSARQKRKTSTYTVMTSATYSKLNMGPSKDVFWGCSRRILHRQDRRPKTPDTTACSAMVETRFVGDSSLAASDCHFSHYCNSIQVLERIMWSTQYPRQPLLCSLLGWYKYKRNDRTNSKLIASFQKTPLPNNRIVVCWKGTTCHCKKKKNGKCSESEMRFRKTTHSTQLKELYRVQPGSWSSRVRPMTLQD
jgi:hypothetical protein